MKNQIKDRDEHYLKFKKGDQTRFMRSVKDKCFGSWIKLADFLGVNRSMIFLYLSEECKLPKTGFEKMIKISNLNPNNFLFKIVHYSIYGVAKIPHKITPELSEFVGIMLGDGNISKVNYQITISGGIIDGCYITNYVPQLIKKLFSKGVYFRKIAKAGLDCKFSSKAVCEYLMSKMGIVSPKTNCVIPKSFFEDHNILRSCVRGLFDTDGGLHKHHKNSAQLQFTNKSYSLIQSLRNALIQLGFKPSQITINHKERNTLELYLFDRDVRLYFKEIGSSNPKNNLKFETWVKEGKVPLNKEMTNANSAKED
ncbi:LAGLIDADG family homing endonuclease [Candidatus Woesearchaeota archaeon]|nr:LAGLIDADG family homing endonuclease [Candidatus Woesearchaeota archaeon]